METMKNIWNFPSGQESSGLIMFRPHPAPCTQGGLCRVAPEVTMLMPRKVADAVCVPGGVSRVQRARAG